MTIAGMQVEAEVPTLTGVRMNAEQFLRRRSDSCRYELVDGVVVTSLGASQPHEMIANRIHRQLEDFLDVNCVGVALRNMHVHLGEGSRGGDLVYRPEIVFIRAERLCQVTDRVIGAPDVVVEVVSLASRRMDTETKKDDYERLAVQEYWLIDPPRQTMAFYRLAGGRWSEAKLSMTAFDSKAVPGFTLQLTPIRQLLRQR